MSLSVIVSGEREPNHCFDRGTMIQITLQRGLAHL